MKKTSVNRFKTIKCNFLFVPVIILTLVGCNNVKEPVLPQITYDYRSPNENLYLSTINSLVSVDAYDREFNEADVTSSDRMVGMFYFVWHGNHINNVYDVEKFKANNPDELWNKDSLVAPTNEFFYFSEPLYGYYCSNDPWVIMRHMELLTMNGVDYISLDLTNIGLYEENIIPLLDCLLDLQAQGWRIPLVTECLTGTAKEFDHPGRITKFYNDFYTNPKYDSLWLRDPDSGKPMISVDIDQYLDPVADHIKDAIIFRNIIWPYGKSETLHNDTSWLDWTYPQRVYHNNVVGNYMSVSVSQHTAGAFGDSVNPSSKGSFYNENRGRGWDYETMTNKPENINKGTNFEQQWKNAITCSETIDEVFVTGWNEWIAYKLNWGVWQPDKTDRDPSWITFCDQCDVEFSRDLEMTKGFYGDNFYLQNMRLTREFKNSKEVKFFGSYYTPSLAYDNWDYAREYKDFVGDAMPRNWDDASHQIKYTNDTNRNDIVSTKVASDDNYLYIQVKTKDKIVIDDTKNNNLNILLSVNDQNSPRYNGYSYVINRTPISVGKGQTSLEKIKNDGVYEFDALESVDSYRGKDYISIAIPLTSLGIEPGKEFTVDFKVADGISNPEDIMNYYIDGDSAPIGRLNYRYNSVHE